MSNKLTPPQKLDKILTFLRNTESKMSDDGEEEYFATTADVTNYLYKECDYQVTSKEVSRLFGKLRDDGHIYQNSGNCYLTYNGYLFEGYEQQIINRAAENTRLVNLENAQMVSRNQMNFLTGVIAVGTLVAAIYYLYFLIQDVCHCEFWFQK